MSSEYSYLPFTHDELPVEKTFSINGKSYAIEVNYNDIGDFYTLMITDEESGELLFTTKLAYLCEVVDAVVTGITMTQKIMPALPADVDADVQSDTQITQDTFDEVRLWLM